MKALVVSSVASMIDQFCMGNIATLQQLGYEVDVACNFNNPGTITKEKCELLKNKLAGLGVNYYQVDFSRSVFKITKHFKSLNQMKNLLKNNQYQIIHCHSPIGGMITRLAVKKHRKKEGLKVIYTAHGFHFYKGAPKKNWLIFYPIEKTCSRWTDILITINKEDYAFAKRKMKAKQIEYLPGVGIDIDKFQNASVDVNEKRKEIGIPEGAKLIFSVGELNKNKNHQVVIKALSKISSPNYYYAIAGVGQKHDYLYSLAKELNVNLVLLGFRTDVSELYKTADLFVLPSIREGLNVSLIEAMASGCRVIASDIRGNRDMLSPEKLFDPLDVDKIVSLITHPDNNEELFYKLADVKVINKRMSELYAMNN